MCVKPFLSPECCTDCTRNFCNMEKSSAYILVHGMVQGVGFRYFALQQAQSLGITGYVKNRVDGTVESRVEGQRPYIEAYISALESGPGYADVTHVDVDWLPFENKYKHFTISR